MEYLERGDPLTYLEKSRLPFLEAEPKEIAFQILEGLDMMHQIRFAHRDLKPNVRSLNSIETEADCTSIEHPDSIAPTKSVVGQAGRFWDQQAYRRSIWEYDSAWYSRVHSS